MSNFFDTKIKKKIFAYLSVIILCVTNIHFLHAADDAAVSNLRQQQQDLAAKLANIKKQIAGYNAEIDKTQKQQSTLKNQLSIFDNSISTTELQIQANETQIKDTELQIQALQIEIDKKKAEIEQNKLVLAQLIVELHEMDTNNALNVGLGSGNFSDFLDQVQYTSSVQNNLYNLLKKIQEIKVKLETQQKDLQSELKKQKQLQEQLQVAQEALEAQRRQKQTLLDQTRGIERNFQNLKSQSQGAQNKLEQEINSLDASIRAKLGNKTIAPAKGVMACPMAGKITQGYGRTGFTSLGYDSHNGIDVAAPAGTPIYAPADGVVVGADTGEAAYGNWVAIKSSIQTSSGIRQVITLMAHMRSFKVSSGQTVLQGDLIGYEGNSGNTTRLLYGAAFGYHVHIGVYDVEGFGIKPGAQQAAYGHYSVPYGYTYDPRQFMSC